MSDPRGEGRPLLLEEPLAGLAEAARKTARELAAPAGRYASWVRQTLESGNRLLLCGNGGSAATAQHVAAEYTVRFRRRRRPLPAEALGASVPELTAAANDFGFEASFARAVEARGAEGDLLVLYSTSGSSRNVIRAAEAAGRMGLRTVALTGSDGETLAETADLCLAVPSDEPARIQELHLALEHAVVDRVEERIAGAEPGCRSSDDERHIERRRRGATDGGARD